ncbi:MAG: hypothetical protein AAF449_10595, partial [Myxococcota bacterium]
SKTALKASKDGSVSGASARRAFDDAPKHLRERSAQAVRQAVKAQKKTARVWVARAAADRRLASTDRLQRSAPQAGASTEA